MAKKEMDPADIAVGGFAALALLGLGYAYFTAKECPNCHSRNALHRTNCWNCNTYLD